MWLSAHDIGAATTVSFTPSGFPTVGTPLPGSPSPTPASPSLLSAASAGDSYGLLLLLKLRESWTWTSEYSSAMKIPT
jgi:hypothetical protein